MALSRKRGTPALVNVLGRNPWAVRPQLVGLEDRITPDVAKWVGAVDNKWSTNVAGNTNWFDVSTGVGNYIPRNGDDLLFDDTAVGNFVNTDDLAALTTVNNITITQGGAKPDYTITATAPVTQLAVAGNVTVSVTGTPAGPIWAIPIALAGNVTVANVGAKPLTIAGDVNLGANTLTVSTNTGTVSISGAVSGTGGLVKTGTGELDLVGATANTYTGMTVVTDGTVRVGKTGGGGVIGIAGDVQVGDGVGAAKSAVLQLDTSNNIADTGNVTVNADGFVSLAAGVTDTVNNLIVNAGGAVATGTGALTVAGTATIAGTAGNDTFVLTQETPGTAVTVNGTAVGTITGKVVLDGVGGNDTLTGSDTGGTFTVTAANAGTRGPNVSFVNIGNLVGGAGDDTFAFANGATLTGTVDGGKGTNTLDYSQSPVGVSVNLGSNAPGLTGTLEANQEVPGTTSTATGTVTVSNINPGTNKFDVTVTVNNLTPAQVTGFSLRQGPAGVTGPVLVDLFNATKFTPTGTGFTYTATGVSLPATATAQAALLGGLTYLNIQTAANPTGDVRAQLVPAGPFVAVPGVATGTAGVANISKVVGSPQDDGIVGSVLADTLSGGAGNDILIGSKGNDTVSGGPGNDFLVWNNGDGSDVLNGDDGTDTVVVNGSPTQGDAFTIAPNGTRVSFQRTNLVPFTLDIGTTENLVVNGAGGGDTFTVADLSGVANLTSLTLAAPGGNNTFGVTPSVNTAVTVAGGAPASGVAGNTLTIVPGAATGLTATAVKNAAGQLTGQVTSGNRAAVKFSGINTLTGVTVSTGNLGFPFAVGPDVGGGTTVATYDLTGKQTGTLAAFDATVTGGVRVAMADVNGDGVADVIVGSGPGSAPSVIVYDGKTNAKIATLTPFEASFTGGVYVTAGDIDGDGKADVIVTPDQGGGPVVTIYSGAKLTAGATGDAALITRYFGIVDPNFRGGARAAVGDVNGDGTPDVAVAAGFLGGPRVSVWNGKTLTPGGTPQTLFNDFFAFEQTLRNGVFIAVGDVNGDGMADIVAGGGPGGGPRVTVFSGKDLVSSGGGTLTQLANFFAGDPNNRGGVRLTTRDIDGDGLADIITGPGTGNGGTVTAYLAKNIPAQGNPSSTAFTVAPFSGFNGGVFVG